MHEITDTLLFADIDQAGEHYRYERHGITDIVQMSHESAFSEDWNHPPERVTVHTFAVMDGPRNDAEVMEAAIETTVNLLRQDRTVLVHCAGGMSRSPSVAAAAYAVTEGVAYQVALDAVRDAKDVNIHEAVLENARTAAQRLR